MPVNHTKRGVKFTVHIQLKGANLFPFLFLQVMNLTDG